jgi:hypothetical protein
MDGPKPPTALQGIAGLKVLPVDKAKAISDWKICSYHMTFVTHTTKTG